MSARVERPPGDDRPDPTILDLSGAPDFEARDGDVLVVSYPEVTLPLPAKFAMVKGGGTIYTRKLVAGESVRGQFDRVYAFLAKSAELTIRAKLAKYAREFKTARQDSEE